MQTRFWLYEQKNKNQDKYLRMELKNFLKILFKWFPSSSSSQWCNNHCHSCIRTKVMKKATAHFFWLTGYNPVMKNDKDTWLTNTEADWTKCDDNATYGVGKYYPWRTENCCDCPIVVCHKCPEIVLSRPPADWGKGKCERADDGRIGEVRQLRRQPYLTILGLLR